MSAAKRTTAGKRSSRKPGDDTVDAVEARSAANSADVEERIRRRAYDIYCARNECDGTQLQDWLAAEHEVRSNDVPREGHARVLDTVANDDRPDAMR